MMCVCKGGRLQRRESPKCTTVIEGGATVLCLRAPGVWGTGPSWPSNLQEAALGGIA